MAKVNVLFVYIISNIVIVRAASFNKKNTLCFILGMCVCVFGRIPRKEMVRFRKHIGRF